MEAPIKVACIGDSITAGYGVAIAEYDSYPMQLNRMLGEKWEVRNFGINGATLLNSGDNPYQKQNALASALRFLPQKVIIMLGTNDTKLQNWKFKEQFVTDYKELIGKLRALPTSPEIFVCYPVPFVGKSNGGINESGVQEVIGLVNQLAQEENVKIIDMHKVFQGKEALLPDSIHPNTEGTTLLAKTAFQALTGKEFEGEIPKENRSQWNKSLRLDFAVDGRACTLVVPNKPAKGNPWIWRTEFFGAFPEADVALLGKGYYVAYMNLENMYGAPVAIAHMDRFYEEMTQKRGLAPKVVVEGFSRGGLFAFNWAAQNPLFVQCLYVDAPVCDFKSWPAGKGKGKGSPKDWERCKVVYHLSEEEAMAYSLNPIDRLKSLADAHMEILSVCGDADDVVPMEENTNIVLARYLTMGGVMKVITKPGVGHHPHSLVDPTPIVNFIVAHE